MLRLVDDGRLVALVRDGNDSAFEVIVGRYQARLLGFCRQMLGCTEDAEDVLQEVFVNAYRALLADNKEIKLRPWLYRIARNRCLNHLRRPTADGQDSMDGHAISEAASTHERVQNREEFRQLLSDVSKLPETQRTALLLREMDALAYEEIAQAMETTVPSVKSLLVRARIGLAEASQARLLTCGEVRLELAEAAEGLGRASGPVRKHVRDCEQCQDFRDQLRSNEKVLAALFPVGLLALAKSTVLAKLGLGGGSAGTTGAGASAAGAGGGVLGGAGATGAAGAAGGIGGAGLGGAGIVGAAVGTKAAAGVVTAALLTAGAVEVKNVTSDPDPSPPAQERIAAAQPQATGGIRAPAASASPAGPAELQPDAAAADETAVATTSTTTTPATTDATVATTPTTPSVPPTTTTPTATTPTPTTTTAGSITASIHGTSPPPPAAPVVEEEEVSSGPWTGSEECEAVECVP